jgi:tetratricopeptide (TPR) repeat protein
MAEALAPEQLVVEGKSAYQGGDFAAAARAFEAAAHAYTAAGDALSAAEAWNNASVAHLQAEEYELALGAVVTTPAVFASAGDERRQGMALGNLGAAQEGLGRLEEAAENYLQSAELLGRVGEDQLRAHVMKSLSALQMRTGKQFEALATMQSGLDGVKKPNPQQRLLKRLLGIPFKMLGK